MMSIIKADDISIQFGGLRAVSNFKMEIEKGELVGLIGPNGAGKTTVFNMLTGVYKPTEGKVLFVDKKNEESMVDTTGFNVHKITQLGMARTFQNIRLFKNLSVLDNVRIAYHFNCNYNALTGILRLPTYFKREKEIEEKTIELLKIFNIDNKKDELASNLPYGEQRKLEIVRAMATNPKLLLLDEPAAGMNPNETIELMELISFIREEFDLTILLIEHDMHLVMNICERLFVLDYGITIAEGTPKEVSSNPKVIKAYLGEEMV